MLSPESMNIVRATLPAVGAAIGEITELFYRKMFAAHPELERDLFNRGNQKQGGQQKALADAFANFAGLQLEPDADKVRAVLTRIANKHASLGITADQYRIVHKYLFQAIVTVLGDAATPDVAGAWDELFWLMADTLVSLEADLYRSAGIAPGDVWRTVKIRRRALQSADTVSFVMTSLDGTPLPEFAPGQYVSVAVRLPDGARQIRQYSLTGAPSHDDWRISVKLVTKSTAPDGTDIDAGEVSNFLYHNVFEGDTLEVTHPFGDVVLSEGQEPLLLVSAGIGCTPIIGMLNHLAETSSARSVAVLHADRSAAGHAHRAELIELAERLPHARVHRWYEDLGDRQPGGGVRLGRVDLDALPIEPGTRAYLCGPLPFMTAVRDALIARDVPRENIHYEVFGPDTGSRQPV
ncbi:globin domain-containing protein [Mycobacterium sp. URHB0021]